MKAVRKNDSKKRNAAASAANANSNTARKPLVPSSPPTTVELRGVSIHFPFKPYKCQEDYMSKVLDALHHSENALLESPTGTGKTLCLLCAALAWQREQARTVQPASSQQQHQQQQQQQQNSTTNTAQQRRKGKHVPVIIYASRTHSQLSQVVRELKNTRYRPKHALLGSREQMCVNPKVKTATSTVTDINHECNRLGKDRKCRFRNQLEGFTPDSNEAGGAGAGIQPVMDMEDLLQMGKTRKVCPFYYTRSLIENAELLLVPYNYLFDKVSNNAMWYCMMQCDVPVMQCTYLAIYMYILKSYLQPSPTLRQGRARYNVARCSVEQRCRHFR
jgi:Rad3-related DNA helicase